MFTTSAHPIRRGAAFWVACSAAVGGALIVVACLPQLLRLGTVGSIILAVLALACLVSVVVAAARPGKVWLIGAAATAMVILWLITESGGAGPDLWAPVDATVGLTSRIVLVLQLLAVAAACIAYVHRPAGRSWRSRVAGGVTAAPVLMVIALMSTAGSVASSNGFTGSPLPARTGTVDSRTTMEYCRPDGVPLSMDLYRPQGERTGPVVVYVHGGGFMLGNRTMRGPWASAHVEALFEPIRERLNADGIAVASIDYRLLPGSGWRAPVEDVKCAVRFLRANATSLGIDGSQIGAWGSSAGGTLVSLLALAPGFETSQYADQADTVQAVVNMFGPSDLTRLGNSSGFARVVARLALGSDREVRRALSPIYSVSRNAPPFLILHGLEDRDMPIQLSQELSSRLRQVGVPATFVAVHGTGHTLATPTEQPSPDALAGMVADFFARTLR